MQEVISKRAEFLPARRVGKGKIVEIIYIVLILLLISIVNAVDFYILIYPELTIKEAFKLITTAAAFNKLLFTGSGYLTASYLSRNKNLPFYKALSAFLLLEALGVSLWLGLGIYFGAKIAVKIPWFIIPFLIIFAITAWFKKDKLASVLKSVWRYFKERWVRIIIIAPLVVLNTALFVLCYFFLFRFFNFHPTILSIIKIISISFTVGYLSPAPAGLGFKDTGLVLLLMNSGLTLNAAVSLAVFDRVFVTVFRGVLGGIFGYDLIKEEIKRRFKKIKK